MDPESLGSSFARLFIRLGNTVLAGFCDQPPSGGSSPLNPAQPLKQEALIAFSDHLVAIPRVQTLALAAALALATSTPLTEGGRKTQW